MFQTGVRKENTTMAGRGIRNLGRHARGEGEDQGGLSNPGKMQRGKHRGETGQPVICIGVRFRWTDSSSNDATASASSAIKSPLRMFDFRGSL